MEVEITEMRLITGAGALQATCDIRLENGLEIFGVKIVRVPGKPVHLYLPQASWTDKSGQAHYQTLLKIPGGTWEAINKVVLEKFRVEAEKKGAEGDAGADPTR